MKIAVLGAGAMGSIYGGHLSTDNDVYMIDKKAELVDKINADGLKLFENDTDVIYHPAALLSSEGIGEVDLVIIFVKALYSRAALMENKGIIGDNTYVMTLQNGAGHEDIILEFVPKERIIIGTTEDNGAILGDGYVRRGGKGKTNIGMLVEDSQHMLDKLRSVLTLVDLIHTFMIISSSLYGTSCLLMFHLVFLQEFFRFQSDLSQQMNMLGIWQLFL